MQPNIFFSYFSTKTYAVGTRRNRLNETVAPKTHVSIDGLVLNTFENIMENGAFAPKEQMLHSP